VSEELQLAVAALERGEVVCLPTETFYGLAVRADSQTALLALAEIKARNADTPFGLLVPSVESLRSLARVWPKGVQELVQRFWPGPLTVVVPARNDLCQEIVGPRGGVAARMSSHPIAAALVASFGAPVTATSANPTGQEPASLVSTARGYFGDQVAVYLDGGTCRASSASTVAELDESGDIRVLREGAIPAAQVLGGP
jgi:L-threonylcarbamoyladenylate synthase